MNRPNLIGALAAGQTAQPFSDVMQAVGKSPTPEIHEQFAHLTIEISNLEGVVERLTNHLEDAGVLMPAPPSDPQPEPSSPSSPMARAVQDRLFRLTILREHLASLQKRLAI